MSRLSNIRISGRKRKTYPSRHDRVQDKRIKRLETVVELHVRQGSITLSDYSQGVPDIQGLNHQIAQGDNDVNRNALQCQMSSLAYRCTIDTSTNTSAITATSGFFRFVLLWDRRPTDAIATNANIFTLDTATVRTLINRDKEFAGRFQIIKDMVISLPPPTSQTSVPNWPKPQPIFWKGYINLKNKNVTWNTTAGTQAGIEKNQLLLYTMHDLGTNLVLTFDMTFRLMFTP